MIVYCTYRSQANQCIPARYFQAANDVNVFLKERNEKPKINMKLGFILGVYDYCLKRYQFSDQLSIYSYSLSTKVVG